MESKINIDIRKNIKPGIKLLEEAAEEWVFRNIHDCDVVGEHRCEESFIAGVKWQKEQMLKDVYVESQIVEDGRIELEGDQLPCLNPIILLPYPQFKPGDKVRIVILKAEED